MLEKACGAGSTSGPVSVGGGDQVSSSWPAIVEMSMPSGRSMWRKRCSVCSLNGARVSWISGA
jgi:hypothetical protein